MDDGRWTDYQQGRWGYEELADIQFRLSELRSGTEHGFGY
jgi:hypothetical protein